MSRMPILAVALAALAGACSGGAPPSAKPPAVASAATGDVLVDARGMTLYVYDRDGPGQSHCTGLCAAFWPPALASADAAPPGADWSVVARGGGARQWAYKGSPLYTWAEDGKPGDRTGDGKDGVWHLARP